MWILSLCPGEAMFLAVLLSIESQEIAQFQARNRRSISNC